MLLNKTHIPYEEFLEHVNLIVLKDSHAIKNSLRNNHRKAIGIIDNVLKGNDSLQINSQTKKEITRSMYSGGTLEEKSQQLSSKHNIPIEISNQIYEALETSKIRFEHEGKRPLGKWSFHPNDYKGFEDEKYGTAFQTTWIPSLGLFFNVIDLDSHDEENDIPMDKLMDAIPDDYINTRIINTPTNGKHLFYLSKKPLKKRESPNINIDYRAIRGDKVEKTKEGFKTHGQGGYVVSSFRWSYDGKDKERYVWDEDSNPDILIVDDVDDVLSPMYTQLRDSGDISDEEFRNLMEMDLEESVDSIVDAIDITSKNPPQNGDDSNNERTALLNEMDSLKYDDNDMLLLNTENGIQLITNQVGEILKKTKGKHRTTLMALDGGLERLNFPKPTREMILLSGLKIANDLTSEHKSQVKLSIGKDKSNRKKTGFPTIVKDSPNVRGEIQIIKNIHQLFWRNISPMSYKLIEIPFLEILEEVSQLISYDGELGNLNDDEFDNFVHDNISDELDSYLEMLGVGLNERCCLLKQCFLKLNRNPSTSFQNYVSNKLSHGDDGYGKTRFGRNILPYKKTSFGKRVFSKLEIENGDAIDLAFLHVERIDELSINLDIQISHMERIRGEKPYIQPLINLIERPRGWQEYKRRQHAFKYLKDNDYLKKTKRHDYIFDSVENNAYIEINPRGLGNFLSKKYPILRMGIEEDELRKILNISNTFDELRNEYYIFNNGVLKLHERTFEETNDFHDYFTIKKMDCDIYFHKSPLDLNPLSHEPSNLWDKTMREILIPDYKDFNPNLDIGDYLDCLERIGSCFNTRIKDKKFICYYNEEGDNGKGILIEMLKLIFGDRFLLVTMDVIQDDKLDLSEYDVIAIDELDELSFDDAIAFIKRITGGEEDGTAQREHYSHDAYIPKNPSAFFLFTNTLPQVDLSDNAFYRREDAIKLHNRFIVNPNPTKSNEFREDSDLKEKLKSEIAIGREWIVNASLQAYYNRHDENGKFLGFTRGQTSEETKMIVSNTNPMTKFLLENYVVDNEEKHLIKNSSICDSYRNYCLREKITFHPKQINANMGRRIRDVFGDIKVKKSDGNYYPLKQKSSNDDGDIVFQINEETQWDDIIDNIPHKQHNQYWGVYSRISELNRINTPPTRGQMKREFGMYNVEGMINLMIELELIYQSTLEEIET